MRTLLPVVAMLFVSLPGLAAPTPPYFTDVTADAGLTGILAFRVATADLDGDGFDDVVVHTKPDAASGDVLDKQFVYLSVPGTVPGTRRFVDHTAASGIRANRQGTVAGRHSDAAIFGDVDNDGDLDVFTNVYVHRTWALNKGTNDLLLNDGSGHFTLAPSSPFHTEPIYNTAAAVFVDYDNDGRLDLWIGNWYCGATTQPWCRPGVGTDGLTWDHLYRGNGDGSFTNVTTTSGLSAVHTVDYGIAAFDWNNDGFIDLFAAPYSHTSIYSAPRHWKNNGNGTFTQVQATSKYDQNRGFGSNVASFGSMPRDYDNDGDFDFCEVLTHGGTSTGKYSGPVRNDAGVFSWDWTRVVGRGTEDPDVGHDGDHHVAWTDVDGDMLADYVLTESGYNNNRIYLFRQQPNGKFQPDTVNSGFNDINVANLAPGNVIPVDYDRDGDEDLLIGLDGAALRLYRNDVGTANHWVNVRLQGVGRPGYANRSAIGAKVSVTAGGVTQTREVSAGNGHQGPQVPLALTFGLGAATSVDSIRVRWPNPALTVSEVNGVAADQFLVLREPCPYATDPARLRVAKTAGDVVLTWDDPLAPGWTFNVYRDGGPDPATWGAPHATNVTDQDATTPGIQYEDTGAVAGPSWFYLVTAVNECGETGLY